MYKKLFESMYNGSLVTTGPWEALVTFQQMIILADKFGVVDMTPQVIARRTGIPLDIILTGIGALEQPDSTSRSADLDGRRIDRLADHRDWGWRIVNFTYYDSLRRADERAAYQAEKYRERKSQKPKKSMPSEKVSTHSTGVNNSTLSTPHSQSHSQSQSELQSELQSEKLTTLSRNEAKASAVRVLHFLNEKTGRSYRETKTNLAFIMGRLADPECPATESDLRGVVARMCREWMGTPQEKYLRPETLFNKTKFESYIGQKGT
jgi:uncharacterized phage protein (TIGR02220 family)